VVGVVSGGGVVVPVGAVDVVVSVPEGAGVELVPVVYVVSVGVVVVSVGVDAGLVDMCFGVVLAELLGGDAGVCGLSEFLNGAPCSCCSRSGVSEGRPVVICDTSCRPPWIVPRSPGWIGL
jgi:hypothetical protein